jgi:energy-converting hydrogenase Eha subunit H
MIYGFGLIAMMGVHPWFGSATGQAFINMALGSSNRFHK